MTLARLHGLKDCSVSGAGFAATLPLKYLDDIVQRFMAFGLDSLQRANLERFKNGVNEAREVTVLIELQGRIQAGVSAWNDPRKTRKRLRSSSRWKKRSFILISTRNSL